MRSGLFYTWAVLMVLMVKNLQCASVYSRGWFFVKYTVMNMMVMSLLVSLVTGCETSNQNYSHSGRVVDITKTSSGQTQSIVEPAQLPLWAIMVFMKAVLQIRLQLLL